MCKQCQTNPVYEFTNKRKLCKTCFLRYFQKKILYTIRKFHLIKSREVIGYKKNNSLKSVVLSDILKFVSDKTDISLTNSSKKADKIATTSSIDSEAEDIIKSLIAGNASELKKFLPVVGKEIKKIKPFYLFLDEEILLYAKLKGLKFNKKKKDKSKIAGFEDELEKKHPEAKRAVVNSLLKLLG